MFLQSAYRSWLLYMGYKMVDFPTSSVGLQVCNTAQRSAFFLKEMTKKQMIKQEDKRITLVT